MTDFNPIPTDDLLERPPPAGRGLWATVLHQTWAICIAYLVLGLGAEVARRLGWQHGGLLQSFLDGLPMLLIRRLGCMEPYLSAVADGRIAPFWNRLLLSSATLVLIAVQALLIGLVLMGLWKLLFHRRAR